MTTGSILKGSESSYPTKSNYTKLTEMKKATTSSIHEKPKLANFIEQYQRKLTESSPDKPFKLLPVRKTEYLRTEETARSGLSIKQMLSTNELRHKIIKENPDLDLNLSSVDYKHKYGID